MNDILQLFARNYITEGLSKCTPAQRIMFGRMYGPDRCTPRQYQLLNDIHTSDMEDIVNAMTADKLDTAMRQVQNTMLRKKLPA